MKKRTTKTSKAKERKLTKEDVDRTSAFITHHLMMGGGKALHRALGGRR